MSLIADLRLETRDEPLKDDSTIAPGVMITPALDENFWLGVFA